MKSVLTIIDMQDYFLQRGLNRGDVEPAELQAEWDTIVDVIRKQISKAKRNKMPIVVLEYDNSGPTTAKILRTIRGYELAARVKKYRNDGSSEVMETIGELMGGNWVPSEFRITGVNRAFCVADTVRGLSQEFPDSMLNLIEDAIGDEHGDYYGWGWSIPPRNTTIINSRAVA